MAQSVRPFVRSSVRPSVRLSVNVHPALIRTTSLFYFLPMSPMNGLYLDAPRATAEEILIYRIFRGPLPCIFARPSSLLTFFGACINCRDGLDLGQHVPSQYTVFSLF